MNRKYLILLSFFIISCGGSESTSSPPTIAESSQTAPITTVSSQLTPMERGAKIYKRCKACHTLEDGGKHKVGPNLWNIYGMKAGSKEGFSYSKAMAASEIIWDETTMDAYITKPSTFMKGNRMSFIGLKKQEDRDAVQLYMQSKTTP